MSVAAVLTRGCGIVCWPDAVSRALVIACIGAVFNHRLINTAIGTVVDRSQKFHPMASKPKILRRQLHATLALLQLL